ncbi:MAG: hypothetical protein P0S96_06490 [Simkaniaceae bacterium]|nr:hypothetical protein [Candidatus Sacchlamyda saccharinae]
MIKSLTKVGNSKALVIEKSILLAAGLNEDAKFQITINPNGGIVIQSVDISDNDEQHKKNVKKVIKRHSKMIKRLADQ